MSAVKWLASASLLLAMASTAHAQAPTRDFQLEEVNRKLVVEFYDRVFNKHQVAEGASLLVENYKQHNPAVPDGKAPFVSFFTSKFKNNPEARARIVRSSSNDDLVWLHVHSTDRPDDRGRAIVDIFRVKDGKIIEHWDVIQAVPEKAANSNTMF